MIFISCNKFYKFDQDDISFEIVPKKEGILRAINTEGEGARKLQFFSTNGKLLDEITVHNEPFAIRRWENDTIEIMFHIGDYALFEPWFKTNKYKPTKINNYNIIYSYKKISTINPSTRYDIDSFYINKDDHKVTLFSKNKLLNSVPIEEFTVYIDRFEYEEFNNGTISCLEYFCQDQGLIKKYMKDILKLYK